MARINKVKAFLLSMLIIAWLYLSMSLKLLTLPISISLVAHFTKTFSMIWEVWMTYCNKMNGSISIATKLKTFIFFFESMMTCVFSSFHQFKIIWSIICKIFVNMMHNFIRQKFSSNYAFYYNMTILHMLTITRSYIPTFIFNSLINTISIIRMIFSSLGRHAANMSHFFFVFFIIAKPFALMFVNESKRLSFYPFISRTGFEGYFCLLPTSTLTKPYRDFRGRFQYGLLHFGHILISSLRGIHEWLHRKHLRVFNFMEVSITYV